MQKRTLKDVVHNTGAMLGGSTFAPNGVFCYYGNTMKLTKYEQVGILLSAGVMAIALFVYKHQPDVFAMMTGNSQTASVASSDDVEERLTDAFSGKELSKLVIEDVRVGTGAAVTKGDTVEVQYAGRLQDGTEFDSSYKRGDTFSFKVGAGRVIAGWEEGLVGMQVGGERVLVIPASMAYGNRQVGIIPPNSPLVFSIELLNIK